MSVLLSVLAVSELVLRVPRSSTPWVWFSMAGEGGRERLGHGMEDGGGG